jgi:hypothetical protein
MRTSYKDYAAQNPLEPHVTLNTMIMCTNLTSHRSCDGAAAAVRVSRNFRNLISKLSHSPPGTAQPDTHTRVHTFICLMVFSRPINVSWCLFEPFDNIEAEVTFLDQEVLWYCMVLLTS